jgi:hypothetical protein
VYQPQKGEKKSKMPKRKMKENDISEEGGSKDNIIKEDRGKNDVKYKGVTKEGNKFRARIRMDGNYQSIGTFDTRKEAAAAYERVRKKTIKKNHRVRIEAGKNKTNFLNDQVASQVVRKNDKPKKKKLRSDNTIGYRGVTKSPATHHLKRTRGEIEQRSPKSSLFITAHIPNRASQGLGLRIEEIELGSRQAVVMGEPQPWSENNIHIMSEFERGERAKILPGQELLAINGGQLVPPTLERAVELVTSSESPVQLTLRFPPEDDGNYGSSRLRSVLEKVEVVVVEIGERKKGGGSGGDGGGGDDDDDGQKLRELALLIENLNRSKVVSSGVISGVSSGVSSKVSSGVSSGGVSSGSRGSRGSSGLSGSGRFGRSDPKKAAYRAELDFLKSIWKKAVPVQQSSGSSCFSSSHIFE